MGGLSASLVPCNPVWCSHDGCFRPDGMDGLVASLVPYESLAGHAVWARDGVLTALSFARNGALLVSPPAPAPDGSEFRPLGEDVVALRLATAPAATTALFVHGDEWDRRTVVSRLSSAMAGQGIVVRDLLPGRPVGRVALKSSWFSSAGEAREVVRDLNAHGCAASVLCDDGVVVVDPFVGDIHGRENELCVLVGVTDGLRARDLDALRALPDPAPGLTARVTISFKVDGVSVMDALVALAGVLDAADGRVAICLSVDPSVSPKVSGMARRLAEDACDARDQLFLMV